MSGWLTIQKDASLWEAGGKVWELRALSHLSAALEFSGDPMWGPDPTGQYGQYVRWATMWHKMGKWGKTWCGRKPGKGAQFSPRPPGSVVMVCWVCKQRL